MPMKKGMEATEDTRNMRMPMKEGVGAVKGNNDVPMGQNRLKVSS